MARKGKIVEKWDFTVNRCKVTVPVRIHTPEYSDGTTTFSTEYTYGVHQFEKSGSDIDELRRELQKWLKDIVTFASEPFFYVQFCGSVETDRGHDNGTMDEEVKGEVKSTLEWGKYLVGTTADGQKMYRDCTRLLNNGDWIKGDLEVGLKKEDFHFDRGTSMNALIPATPENETGLRRLKEAFEDLHAKLISFLDPKLIEHNFANLLCGMPKLLGVASESS